MKTFLVTALAFVAIPAMGALLPGLRLETARVDLHLTFVVFLALACPTIEGAIGAFAIGYFVELQTGHPMGLFLSATMFTYALARLCSPLVDVHSLWSFGILILGFDVFYGLITLGLATLSPFTRSGSLASVLLSAPLTALAAGLCWPLFMALSRRAKQRGRQALRLR
ncbi:MAG: hypothetical protein LBM75_03280 [Myxococcales bacterium]|nr:hypothetical protein [Myxococcales bacterium]